VPLAGVCTYGLAALAAYFLWIQGRGSPGLFRHWARFYLPLDDFGAAWGFLAENGLRFFTHAFPGGLAWLALLIPLGLLALLARPDGRPLGLSLLLLYAGLFLASALSLYPVGGGRVDVHSYPVSILAAVGALWLLHRRIRAVSIVAAGLAIGYFLVQFPGTEYFYPASPAREIVERVNEETQAEDGLIVYPWSNWALGTYGKWPVRFVPVTGSANTFYVEPERDGTLVLRESVGGESFQGGPAIVGDQLLPFLTDGPSRLVYMAVWGPTEPHNWIVQAVVASGYAIQHHETYGGGIMIVFTRAEARE